MGNAIAASSIHESQKVADQATSGSAAEYYMDQEQASRFLLTQGVKRSPKTLQKDRVKGTGPPFRKVNGCRVIYERPALQRWAAAQLSMPISSTSELPKTRRQSS